MNEQNKHESLRSIIEKAVIVFVLGYGLHYFGYFIRTRYFGLLETLSIDEGISHVLLYLGHVVFLSVMFLYAWAVKNDRKYFFSFAKGKLSRNFKFALIGAIVGFVQMGICISAAVLNGDLQVIPAAVVKIPVFIFAIIAVFIQASTEEIESRGFVFGKMNCEGVPIVTAAVISSFFFSYLHMTNPGYGWIPLLCLFTAAMFYVLSYYYFKTIWFSCMAHMMWNFAEDFIFGLPNSGRPAAVSLFNTVVKNSSFFYDESFGIEGSFMAIMVNVLSCVAVVLIGRYIRKKNTKEINEL